MDYAFLSFFHLIALHQLYNNSYSCNLFASLVEYICFALKMQQLISGTLIIHVPDKTINGCLICLFVL